MKSTMKLKWLNFISFLFLILSTVNISRGITDPNAVEINPMISPSGIAFAIWFLIFACLLVWCLRPLKKHPEDQKLLKSIGLWFAINMFVTGTSVLVGEPLSILFIVFSLITLMIIYTKITKYPNASKWMKIPFSIYIGWISLATVVDTFVVIQTEGITSLLGFSEPVWTSIMLTVTIILGILFTLIQKDWIYAAVFIWADVWIIFNGRTELIQQTIGVVGILALITTIIISKKIKGNRVGIKIAQ